MKLAKDIFGELISIRDANSNVEYFCADCAQKVFPKNQKPKERRQRDIHFSHYGNCTGNLETYLHAISKIIIATEKRIKLPDIGTINYLISETEILIDDIKPDIIIKPDSGQIALEIFVTHKTDEEKIKKYKDKKITSFEIDLSDLDYNSDFGAIREELIENMDNKIPLYIEEGKPSSPFQTLETIMFLILTGILSVLAFKFLRRHNKKRNRCR
jgi:hypothetical protein